MRYDPVSSELFVENRKRLIAHLKLNSICIIHSNDVMPTNADGSMPFRQNNNLLYLSGIDQEESILVLFPKARRKEDREILFVRETNEHIAVWEGGKLTKQAAREYSGIERVEWTSQFDSVLRTLSAQAEYIYFESNEHHRSDSPVETRNDRFVKRCREMFPLHKYERLAPLLSELRMKKHEVEIEIIRKACAITKAGFLRVLDFVKPGVGEWEIEAEFAHEFLRRKSKGFAYTPIIGSGSASCILHYIQNNRVCRDGDILLMDVAAEYANWNSDLTRTIPVNACFTDRQRAVYSAVLTIFKQACAILKPDLDPVEYQNRIMEVTGEELVKLKLIKASDLKDPQSAKAAVKKYFMHSTSHHLGMDVHDVCLPGSVYEVGNVLTVEPGIYIPEEKIGIRLENDVWLSPDGLVDLMKDIPIEAEEIEELMNKG